MKAVASAVRTLGRQLAAGVRWLMKNEPVLTVTASTAAIGALGKALEDGLTATDAVRAISLAVLGVIVRSLVTKPATVEKLAAEHTEALYENYALGKELARVSDQRDIAQEKLEKLGDHHQALLAANQDLRSRIPVLDRAFPDPLPPPQPPAS